MTDAPIEVREHGSKGATVVVVHGGPGAPGSVAPVARLLSDRYRVLEPFQRRSGPPAGGRLLTVARHIADLEETIAGRAPGGRAAVVGHSWGAMLALAHAAAHPGSVPALVLVGCGTFDVRSRAAFEANLDARYGPSMRADLDRLAAAHPDADERIEAMANLFLPAYSHDPAVTALETARCDARGARESWADMLRLQAAGIYPAAFRAIRAPVLMIHGDADPHPGPGLRETLLPHIPHLEYRELERCGHYPWLERSAREAFARELIGWLGGRAGA